MKKGYIITNDNDEADVIIINTCGFIEAAKTEAIEAILEAAEYKKQKCKIIRFGYVRYGDYCIL